MADYRPYWACFAPAVLKRERSQSRSAYCVRRSPSRSATTVGRQRACQASRACASAFCCSDVGGASDTNDVGAIDAEVGRLAGAQRSSGGDGGRPGFCRRSLRFRRSLGVGRLPVVHRKRRRPLRGRGRWRFLLPARTAPVPARTRRALRGRRRDAGGKKEQDGWNDTHVTGPQNYNSLRFELLTSKYCGRVNPAGYRPCNRMGRI